MEYPCLSARLSDLKRLGVKLNATTQRNAEKRRENEVSADLCDSLHLCVSPLLPSNRISMGLPKVYPRSTQGLPEVYPRAAQGMYTMPAPDQHRINTGAVQSPPACGSEIFRSIQDTLVGDSGQPVFAACGAAANRGWGDGLPPRKGPRGTVNIPGPNRVRYY
jgi:hypothetical protein